MSIQPTVGRVVLYRLSENAQARAAIIAHVNEDDTVNLAVFNENGIAGNAVQVPLVQDTEDAPSIGHFCHWMAYQIGQAAKTEELQTLLAATIVPQADIVTPTTEPAPTVDAVADTAAPAPTLDAVADTAQPAAEANDVTQTAEVTQ